MGGHVVDRKMEMGQMNKGRENLRGPVGVGPDHWG